MSSLADRSELQLGGVALAIFNFMKACPRSCGLFPSKMTSRSNRYFHAEMSMRKLFRRFCSMLNGARALLSHASIVVGFLLLSGCQLSEPKYVGGDLGGVNHTFDAINYFAVNRYGGGNLQPNGFGGGACCVLLPRKWPPGLKAQVDWEVDPNPRADLPSLSSTEYKAAYEKHSAGYRRYSAVVDIPEYTIEGLCSLKIHFLPCKKLKATTYCAMFGSPDYPIKEPQKMTEPSVCSTPGDA